LKTQHEIAKVLTGMKRPEKALELLEEVGEKIRKKFRENHNRLPEIREQIAKIHADLRVLQLNYIKI